VPAFPPFCWRSDNQPLFPDIYAKSQNGFVALQNCFVDLPRRNNGEKNSMISVE
jgi:hypothetical protein